MARRSAARTARRGRAQVPKGKGARYVYDALRQQILDLTLRPGAKLDEMTLVRRLGVSRTPVREALIRLASEGLVFLLPHHGAQVAPLDLLDMAEYFEALEILERIVSRWAAARRTDEDLTRIEAARDAYDAAARSGDAGALIDLNREFHAAIAGAAHNAPIANARLLLLDQGMRLHRIWYHSLSQRDPDGDITRTRAEHGRMVDALARRDGETADQLARKHVAAFRKQLSDHLSSGLAHLVELGDSPETGGRRRQATSK